MAGPARTRVAPRRAVAAIRMPHDARLELGRRAIVLGAIRIAGSLYAEPHVRIRGAVRAEGRVVIGARGRIDGPLHAGLDLHLLPGTQVHGDVHAGADLHVHDGVSVRGRLHALGDVLVHGPSAAATIQAGGRIRTLRWPAPSETPQPS